VIELEGVPELIDPVMVAAFEGWNDAGDAASAAVGHLEGEWKGEVFAALDAEDYYDFQVNRPQVWLDGGVRKVTWPTTRLSVVRADNAGSKRGPRDLVLVRGIEPSMRWRSFCNEILGFAHELGVEMVVVLGALLGDTPHSRPVPVTGVTSDPDLARTMNLEESRYEGPTGIVGILQEACTHAGVPAVSLWASVPHYVSEPPNPKASLALLNGLEDLLELSVPLGDLPEDARAWQLGVDQLAAEDSEVAEYVQSLEEARDTAELPEASGEAIAKEFERYLRRRDDGPGGGPSGTGGNARESGASSSPAVGGEAPKTFGGEPPKRGGSGGRRRTSKPVRKEGKDAKDAKDTKDGKEAKDSTNGEDKDRKDDKAAKEQKDAKEGKGGRQRRGAKGGKSGKDKTADAAGPEDSGKGGSRPEDEEPRASSDGDSGQPGDSGESPDDE
jgi:proteasome assembly chaperone (PAC2) family protein